LEANQNLFRKVSHNDNLLFTSIRITGSIDKKEQILTNLTKQDNK